MSVFDDIRLHWQGRDYVIRSNRVMGAIARIEDHLTIAELQQYSERNTAPLAKIAMAYGAVLRYAGARVDDDEVYEGLFAADDSSEVIMASLQTLLTMMVPPSALVSGPDGSGEPPMGNSKPAAARSSRRPTKQRSASGG